jgi:hypothetical protein
MCSAIQQHTTQRVHLSSSDLDAAQTTQAVIRLIGTAAKLAASKPADSRHRCRRSSSSSSRTALQLSWERLSAGLGKGMAAAFADFGQARLVAATKAKNVPLHLHMSLAGLLLHLSR